MGFVEGKMEEEKVLGGTVLPKVLNPPCTGERRTCDLAAIVNKEHVWLSNLLKWHGALLFRGIELKEFPSKVFFFCSNPSLAGGDISIVPSHIIVEKMEEMVPDFVRRLSETGSIFRIKTRKDEVSVATIASKTWKCLLQIHDQVESEYALWVNHTDQFQNNVHYVVRAIAENGSIEFIYRPMNPIRKLGGKRVWFNTILGSTDNERDLEVSFSDGSPFPVEAVDACKNILEENCIKSELAEG